MTGAEMRSQPPMSGFAVERRVSAARRVRTRRAGYRYTREALVDALRRWASEHGETPRTIDLEPGAVARDGAPAATALARADGGGVGVAGDTAQPSRSATS